MTALVHQASCMIPDPSKRNQNPCHSFRLRAPVWSMDRAVIHPSASARPRPFRTAKTSLSRNCNVAA